MFVPSSRRCAVALVAAVAALLPACGSDGPSSDTPQIELADGEELADLFLTPDDVAPIVGFDGAEQEDLDRVPVFENPDPRGPCGTRVPAPTFGGAAGRALTGANIGLIQIIVPATPDQLDYFEALLADRGPPCDDYTSQTNTGGEQRVSDITLYDTTGEGVRGVSWSSLIEVEDQALYAGLVAVETEGLISYVQVQSAEPIPEQGLEILAGLTVVALRGEG